MADARNDSIFLKNLQLLDTWRVIVLLKHELSISVPAFKIKRMDDLLSDDNIGRNVPMRNKSILSLTKIIGKMILILLAKDLAIIL
jgi:hypothetical protein